MNEFQEVFNFYLYCLDLFFNTAWVWLPFILAYAFFKSWMYYIQRLYWRNLEWIILEVKPPREIEKTPKNMEQIFAGLWGSFGTIANKYQKYIKGVLQDYFSFELVGIDGEIHFYLRILKKYRNLVEAQIYSQYPQAEIKEAEDYVTKVPLTAPNKTWDLWGCKLIPSNSDQAYPIRTYEHFMDLAKTDEPFLDPLAAFMEFMGKMRPGEQLWIQFLFRPIDDKWQGEALKTAWKLIGKKMPKPKESFSAMEVRTWGESFWDVGYSLITGKAAPPRKAAKDEGPLSNMMFLSPGEKDKVAAVEEKASKKGYQCKIQWAYIAKRSVYYGPSPSAVMGIFSQFANLNLNGLRPDGNSMTKANYAFAKMRKAFRQRVLLRMLRGRTFWEEGYVFNIEEMATVYHFPTLAVKGPMTPYVGVKKSTPPTDLPFERP